MSTPVRITVVQMSAHQTHLAIGAVVYGLVAIAWSVIAFNVASKTLRAPAVLLAMFLGIVAITLWGFS